MVYRPTTEIEPVDFLDAIHNIARPEVLHEAAEDLATLVQAVKDRGKTGTMTLKIKIRPEPANDWSDVSVETKTNLPDPTPVPRRMWTEDGGRLLDDPPRQEPLPGTRDDHENVTAINTEEDAS